MSMALMSILNILFDACRLNCSFILNSVLLPWPYSDYSKALFCLIIVLFVIDN